MNGWRFPPLDEPWRLKAQQELSGYFREATAQLGDAEYTIYSLFSDLVPETQQAHRHGYEHRLTTIYSYAE